MCPVVLLTFIFSSGLLLLEMINAFTLSYGPNKVLLEEGKSQVINYTIVDVQKKGQDDIFYSIHIGDSKIAKVANQSDIQINSSQRSYLNQSHFFYSSNFTLLGLTIGHTELYISPVGDNVTIGNAVSTQPEPDNLLIKHDETNHLNIIVTIEKTSLQSIFTISMIILVSLNYINLGCAMDLEIVQNVLKKPIAPALGFVSQYVVMPLISYVIGYYVLGKEAIFYRFGLFAFGCSPGGSASNIWTVLLGGNLNLSLTMTFISTCAALFMIPLWIFALGSIIMESSSSQVPYRNILRSLAVMSFFLGVGLLMQRYLPKVAKICRKILVPASILMITIIIVFGTIAYWFIIKLITWKILFAAGLNVWLGFFFGLLSAFVFRFSKKDIIAISIETGVQNTGISIFLIHFSLNSPGKDLAFIVPITASLLTPIPLITYYVITKIVNCLNPRNTFKVNCDTSDKDPSIMDGKSNLIDKQTLGNHVSYKSNDI